jgi:hypothetical protein
VLSISRLLLIEFEVQFPELKKTETELDQNRIESLNLDDNEGYLNDLSLDINYHTDKLSQVEYEEPLDCGIQSAQDDQSSDEDSISNELAATAGLSHLSLTPASTRRSSHAPSSRSSKGKQREVRRFGGDDWDISMHTMTMATIG